MYWDRKSIFKRAFTLIELLSSMAVIVLLLAILIPVVGTIQSSNNSVKCASNLRQIGVAAKLYSNDHGGAIVPVYYPNENTTDPFDEKHWPGLLAEYVGVADDQDLATMGTVRSVFVCPSLPDRYGYGLNYKWLSPYAPNPETNVNILIRHQNEILNPVETVMITDIVIRDGENWRPFVRPASWGGWKSEESNSVAFRHDNEANVLWADGHVSSAEPNSDFTDTDGLWDIN